MANSTAAPRGPRLLALVSAVLLLTASALVAANVFFQRAPPPEQRPIGTVQTAGWRPRVISNTGTTVVQVMGTGVASGGLDSSFGTGGIARTVFSGNAVISSIAVQPDGKLVAAGHVGWYTALRDFAPLATDFALARYNPDGSLDSTFGSGGGVVTDFESGHDEINALALQPDGKLIAAGWSERSGRESQTDPSNVALARYNADGSLDSSFGTGGLALTSYQLGPAIHDEATGLALQPDGKLMVAGTSCRQCGTSGFAWSVALARYNLDGSSDLSYGTDGRVLVDFGRHYLTVSALVLQPDGMSVVAGHHWQSNDFSLARFRSDGSLDTTFGAGGLVTTEFDNYPRASALVLQPDGKLVVAGYVDTSAGSLRRMVVVVVRYMPDGSLDTTFGDAGRATLDFGDSKGADEAHALVLDSNGRLVVAGGAAAGATSPTGLPPDFFVSRLRPDGTLDPSFGAAGRVVTDLGAAFEYATALVVQPDGKLVAGGYTPGTTPTSPSNYAGIGDFVLVRYFAD